MSDVTALLDRWNSGDPDALKQLIGVVHGELRRLAASQLRHERTDHTLQPTALVHEAYLRLAGLRDMPLTSRRHFYGVAAEAMRRILVDHARQRGADKRGGAHVAAGCRSRPHSTFRLICASTSCVSTKPSPACANSHRRRRAWSTCGISAVCRSKRRRTRWIFRRPPSNGIGHSRGPGSIARSAANDDGRFRTSRSALRGSRRCGSGRAGAPARLVVRGPAGSAAGTRGAVARARSSSADGISRDGTGRRASDRRSPGRLPAGRADRRWRHGHGLPRRTRGRRVSGRRGGQSRPRDARQSGTTAALHDRAPDPRLAATSEHRHPPRRRDDTGRPRVPGDGVRERPDHRSATAATGSSRSTAVCVCSACCATPCTMPISAASCTAISSLATSSSARTARRRCWISGSQRCWTRIPPRR